MFGFFARFFGFGGNTIQRVLDEMKFVTINPGTFLMGTEERYINHRSVKFFQIASDNYSIADDLADEKAHMVTISKPFAIGAYPVTQKQIAAVMGKVHVEGKYKGNNNPFCTQDETELISLVNIFLEHINSEQDAYTYRLPTEAEWEYACRAGTKSVWFFDDEKNVMLDPKRTYTAEELYPLAYESEADMCQYAVCNSTRSTPPLTKVGTKRPNPWGLYDMYGNVWELTQDFYAPYPDGPVTDPVCTKGSARVLRGGSFGSGIFWCRSAQRRKTDESETNMGFRLVRVLRQEASSRREPPSPLQQPVAEQGTAVSNSESIKKADEKSPKESGRALAVNGRQKVRTLKDAFKKEFGVTIRVYSGKKIADDDATLASIRAQGAPGVGEFDVHGRTKVGNVERQFKEAFGITIQIENAAGELADNNVSLTSLKQ